MKRKMFLNGVRRLFLKPVYYQIRQDWEAEWICAPEKAAAIYFRKVCNIKEQPKTGRLHISGLLVIYEAYLNGKKCGEDVLTPNRTHYVERVYYHTYDITTAIVHGENVFGVGLVMDGITKKIKLTKKNYGMDIQSFCSRLK